MFDILFSSPTRRIGKTDWRVLVYRSLLYGPCTTYVWRRGRGHWESETCWPTYNGNDGTYGGLPKSLPKLYEKYRREINLALTTGQTTEPATTGQPGQATLF